MKDDSKLFFKLSEDLQNPEEQKRKKALKKLSVAMRKPVTLDQKVTINLWKGLYKTLVSSSINMNICDVIGNIIASLPVNNLEIFVIEFWNKMCYEWLKVDKHRMDKLYLVQRRVLNGILNCGVTNDWQILPIISNVISYLISSQISTIPDGIKYHFCDIYVDELITIAEQESYNIPLSKLIIPFVWSLKNINNKFLISKIKLEIFVKLLSQIPRDNVFLKDQLMEIHGELIKVTGSKEIYSKSRKALRKLLQDFIKVIESFKIVPSKTLSSDLNNNSKKRKIEEIETSIQSSRKSVRWGVNVTKEYIKGSTIGKNGKNDIDTPTIPNVKPILKRIDTD